MGEIIGLGCTHYPALTVPDERLPDMAYAYKPLHHPLARADYETWHRRPLKYMEQPGQHEILNRMALMGAMETLNRRPVVRDYAETHIFMSDKCFVSYPA